MLANIKKVTSLIVKYKNVTFLYFPLRKVASTFTIVSRSIYYTGKINRNNMKILFLFANCILHT